MQLNKSIVHYLIAGIVFLLLKAWHSFADTDALMFMLKPTTLIVEAATSSASQYIPGDGYYFENLGIIINKSCSGFNFMLICYTALAYAGFRHIRGSAGYLIIPAALLVAYVLTILVNAARIITAVKLGHAFPASKNIGWAHEALGAVIYLSFLILFYLLANVILVKLTNTKHNAEPA